MEFPHKSTGDAEVDSEHRQWLLEDSLEQVFAVYDEAFKANVAQPVVLLVDCADEIGGRFARAWEGDEAIDDALTRFEGETETTATVARAFGFADSKQEVPVLFTYLAESFSGDAPQDGFLTVVVACGGASTFTVPPSARE
jgi:hypothetical protein